MNDSSFPAAGVSLPDTLAGLVEAAIIDARLLDHGTYVPRHDHWHYSGNPPFCEVCLAGSLIAGRLNIPPDATASPSTFRGEIQAKLNTLNCIRLCIYQRAFITLYGRTPPPHLGEMFLTMPKPLCSYFSGWSEFNGHLDSLERLLPSLRAIDDEAAQL